MSRATTLHVNQTSALKRVFTITDMDEKVQGVLTYANSLKSGLHTQAEATYSNQRWAFTTKGIVASYVDIVDLQTGITHEKAYKRTALSRKGIIELNGQTYSFQHDGLGFLHSHYAWMHDNKPFIHFTNGGFIRANGSIEVTNKEEASAPLLIMLGLFIGLNADDDSAAVGS